ncbi:MAG: ABC transporter permease, partial [Planctomycetota bacterium]
MGIGTLFAILLSIATTNSDAKKGVDDFLLSKPIRIYKLFVAKIALAAVLLWIAFLFVSVFDFASESKRGSIDFFTWTAICYTFPIAFMLFAVTMFLVMILRDTTKAALMAIWVALMVYFLPLLVGRLEWMNIFEQLLDNTYNRPSIVRYLIWVCSLPEKIMPGMSISRPAGIEVPVYKMTRFQGLWRIVSSPEYSQYLLFIAVTTVVSVICVILSVKAMKNRWRWQPGQKTIVWTMGLSAAFIFGVAMTQVGHNLKPAKMFDGQNTDSLMRFDTKPEHIYDWVNPDNKSDMILEPESSWADSQLCIDGDYLYKIGSVIQEWEGRNPVVRDWFIDIYQLPSIEAGGKHLVKVRFFSTPPAVPGFHQQILANFIKDGKLYIAYQPRLEVEGDIRNPVRFLVVDLDNPTKPRVLFDDVIYEPKRAVSRTKGSPSNFGDYCYISFLEELVVISVTEDNPEVVNTVSTHELGLGPHWGIPRDLSVLPDKRILCFGEDCIVLLSIANPTEPSKLFYQSFEPVDPTLDRGDTIRVATCYMDKIYISRESGIY